MRRIKKVFRKLFLKCKICNIHLTRSEKQSIFKVMKAFVFLNTHPFVKSLAAFVLGALLILGIQKVFADTTIYYACVKTSNGSIRMVTANTTCGSGETLISWNQTGPQGPQGIQGPPGPTGVPGTSGSSNGLGYSCYGCQLYPFANKFVDQDFSNSQIINGNFYGADVHGVNLKGSYLQGLDFTNANLTGADLSNLIDTYPQAVDPNSAPFNGIGIMFTSANLTNINLSNDIFRGADFSNANLTGADFSNTSFPVVNSTFGGVTFAGANLQSTNFTNAQFNKNDFTGAQNMNTANLTGTTWINVTCPDGTNSDSDGNTCNGHF